MATRVALCLAPVVRMSLSFGKLSHAATCQVAASEVVVDRGSEWQLTLLAMLTLLLFSRKIDISPDEVTVLADSGSSGEDSGDSALAVPSSPRCLSPGRQRLLTSPSRWVARSQSSCASRGVYTFVCTCEPALNAETLGPAPILRLPLFPQDTLCPSPPLLPRRTGTLAPVALRLPGAGHISLFSCLQAALGLGPAPSAPLKPFHVTRIPGKPRLGLTALPGSLSGRQCGSRRFCPSFYPLSGLPSAAAPGCTPVSSRLVWPRRLFLRPPSLHSGRGGRQASASVLGVLCRAGWAAVLIPTSPVPPPLPGA